MKNYKSSENPKNKSKYKFLKRKNICSNSKFDIFFDHLVSPKNIETNDFLVIKPKVVNKNKIVGICVIPFLKGEFYLMNCWRHQFEEFVFQAPTGFLEKDEKPFEAAIRELKEETALICEVKNLVSLGSFIPDAGLVEGRIALFLAKECKKLKLQLDEEIGSSELIAYSKKDIKDFIERGENIGGSTLVACMRSLFYLDNQT